VTLLAVGTILIGGLLAQRSRRRQAESVAQATEADLRRSHDRISDLAGRLITAQEAERARIARELHDGVCQDVAAISVDISHLRQRAGEMEVGAVRESLSDLQRRTASIAESLRLLSHGLHPSVLHHIGLVAALQAQCAEVERQRNVQVTFFADGEVEPASQLVAVSLFRIAQEALRNAARHGRARHATLSLARLDAELMLAISDDGVGFDVVAARQNGGLGLVSIEERARLVQGRVTFDSRPGRGTIVDVRIPVGVVDAARNAAHAEQPGVDRAWAGRATAALE
jgi:signal transduction histidine kinase